ncbi:YwiC-like family protein [Micromonospora sp. U56]|uniref:YwiC-like family protein n=1 Tax=Micromonospora sp. U56 TaxID=2824900 RepID=UPI001B35B4CF|nr:YwiC-like family protein [Micromonospora sp. U56]MBQ0895204.1 YwiC-like family protein [Micromonospora sp. U56]
MATAVTTARPVNRRRRIRRFMPPQHGAWAMLLLPYVVGVALVGPRWPHLPLLGAWLAGYLLSYYAFQAIKTRRPRRFADQLLAYGLGTAPLAATVVLARPAVLWYAPIYAALLAVNVGYAWSRRERALLNDLASVAQSCLLLFIVAAIAEMSPARVVPAFVTLLLYLVGTVFYVKTMIRERGNARYNRLSVGFHLAALAVAAWLDALLVPVFLLLLIRAGVLPARRLRPAQVGAIEIVCSLLVLVVVLIAL